MGSYLAKPSRKRKPDKQEVTDVDRAVLSLKTQRRKINAERKRLEDVIAKNLSAIKELMSRKQKDKALLALKKKKMREEQLKNLDNWLLRVEELLSTIEFSTQQNSIFAALRSGADALKEIQKEVRVEDVEKLTQDTEEAKAYMDEIHETLKNDSAAELADLEDELKTLEDQMQEEQRLVMPTVPKTPAIKTEVEESAVEEQENRQTEEPLAA